MRYSIVLASLAASAMATSYINIVEIGNEQPEILEVMPRTQIEGGSCRNGLRRDEREEQQWGRRRQDQGRSGRRHQQYERREIEELEELEEELERALFGRSQSRRNQRYENHHNQCSRRGSDRRDFDRYDMLAVMDSIFGGRNQDRKYECVTEARTERQEEEAARRCCRQLGGRLVDDQTRCEVRRGQNPERQWRQCTEQQRGVIRADCFNQNRQGGQRRSSHDENEQRHRQNERRISILENELVREIEREEVCDISPQVPFNAARHANQECCDSPKVRGIEIRPTECLIQRGQNAVDNYRQCVARKADISERKVQCHRERRN